MKPWRSKPWVMHLPQGLREQPAWVFIGTLASLNGLTYLLGIAASPTVSRVLEYVWLRGWGGFMFFTGLLVVASTFARNRALERLSLRFLSLGLLVYLGWVLTVVPPTHAMVTMVSSLSLVGLAEIRVAVLKVVMKPLPIILDHRSEEDR